MLARAMALTFRPAREADLDRLLDIHTSAFPDPRDREARVRNFTRNALGTLDDLHVAVQGPDVVAHAFLFRLRAWFGGVLVRIGGIASVGVAPEARGRGVAGALVGHLHDRARDLGLALTALYPFRQGFYARHGYAPTTAYRRLRLDPRAIPPEWARAAAAAAAAPRAAGGREREAMANAWERRASRSTGMLARDDRAWDARFADEQRTWIAVEGGYVCWSLEQSEPHAKTTMLVHEMAACHGEAERALWGVVGAQRDQVHEVHVDVSADDPIDRALVDVDRARFGDLGVEHVLGESAGGPMLRLVDPARALSARGWPRDGALVVQVGESRLAIEAKDGRAAATHTSSEAHLRLDARALAAVAFGALSASHAERLGWARPRDASALALADALFALPPYFSPDPF